MKPIPLNAYQDVEAILDTILRNGEPAEVKFDSHNEALSWRHRAHRFRSAVRQNEELRLGLVTGAGSSKYDVLRMTLAGPIVKISFHTANAKLVIGGQEVAPAKDATDDPFNLDLEGDSL